MNFAKRSFQIVQEILSGSYRKMGKAHCTDEAHKKGQALSNTKQSSKPRSNGKQRATLSQSSVSTARGDSIELRPKLQRQKPAITAAKSQSQELKKNYISEAKSATSNVATNSLLPHQVSANGVPCSQPFIDLSPSRTTQPKGFNPPSREVSSQSVRSSGDFPTFTSSVRSTSNIKLALTADAFKAGVAAKGEDRLKEAKKRYFHKAIALIVVGGLLFIIGITFAILYFNGYDNIQMIGPIFLAIGLLLGICGLVWIPIIKTKLKRQQQMRRTFSL